MACVVEVRCAVMSVPIVLTWLLVMEEKRKMAEGSERKNICAADRK